MQKKKLNGQQLIRSKGSNSTAGVGYGFIRVCPFIEEIWGLTQVLTLGIFFKQLVPLCQLGGVLHLSPGKLANNEPFLNQENQWISGELVGIIAEGQGCSSRSDSTKWCKMKGHYPSDFVTNKYVESSGTHLVKNPESLSRAIESQFKTSPWVLFCRQTPTLCITVYRNKNMLLLLSSTTKTKRNMSC